MSKHLGDWVQRNRETEIAGAKSSSLRDSRAGGIGVGIGKVRHIRLGGLSAYVRIEYSLDRKQ